MRTETERGRWHAIYESEILPVVDLLEVRGRRQADVWRRTVINVTINTVDEPVRVVGRVMHVKASPKPET